MKLTESNIRSIIENTVRRMLKEEEEERKTYSVEQVRKGLRNPLINISDIAEKYWPNWSEGAARSLLSAFSLGRKELSNEDVQGIGKLLHQGGYDI